VSSVAGGSLDDYTEKTEPRSEKKRPSRSGKSENKKQNPNVRKKAVNDRKPSRSNLSEMERVSSENSVDERLAYYRKKYGEDFQMNGAASGSGGRKNKNRKSSGRNKSGGKQQPPADTRKSTGSDNKLQPQPRQSADSSKTADKKKKKGLLGRLLGK